MSHNQCQDLKARYEEASTETKAKHEEALQDLRKVLLDSEERLKAAQKENSDLLQEMVELKKQADKAKVCYGESSVIALVCPAPRRAGRVLRGSSAWHELSGLGKC